MSWKSRKAILSGFILTGCVVGHSGFGLEGEYDDIGGLNRTVTTGSDEAQAWFNRGLAMCYGFNHEEAVRCFEKAIQADPLMVMGYWGMAYSLGPNIKTCQS